MVEQVQAKVFRNGSHVDTVKKQVKPDSEIEVEINEVKPDSHVCDECGDEFDSEKGVKAHSSQVH